MWSNIVIVVLPFRYDISRFFKTNKPVLIQTFMSEFAIKAFNKGILCWLARLNTVKLDVIVSRPKEHRFARKFSAIVTNYGFRFSTLLNPISQTMRDTNT